jgi:hypothetical protein
MNRIVTAVRQMKMAEKQRTCCVPGIEILGGLHVDCISDSSVEDIRLLT